MTEKVTNNRQRDKLQSVLEKNFHALMAAGADKALLKQYSALLACLKRYGLEGLEDRLKGTSVRQHYANRIRSERHYVRQIPNELGTMSLEDLLALVSDEDTPRKNLEKIASDRFGVPQGSMRSFSNRRMLVDKLRTLIRNEQAHATISSLARHNTRSEK